MTVPEGALSAHQTSDSPFFSVIVPVYNVAPYLSNCLDTVLAHFFVNKECHCIVPAPLVVKKTIDYSEAIQVSMLGFSHACIGNTHAIK